MEREWELERMRLYQVRRAHPEWSLPQLSKALARSLSWVKKWLKRFRETPQPSLAMFKSQSRVRIIVRMRSCPPFVMPS